jgi:hypothetical protein
MPDFGAQVRANFHLPEGCEASGEEVWVEVKFLVNKNGSLSQISQVGGTEICSGFFAEIERILKNSPHWIPANTDGTVISEWVKIRIKLDMF